MAPVRYVYVLFVDKGICVSFLPKVARTRGPGGGGGGGGGGPAALYSLGVCIHRCIHFSSEYCINSLYQLVLPLYSLPRILQGVPLKVETACRRGGVGKVAPSIADSAERGKIPRSAAATYRIQGGHPRTNQRAVRGAHPRITPPTKKPMVDRGLETEQDSALGGNMPRYPPRGTLHEERPQCGNIGYLADEATLRGSPKIGHPLTEN